MIATCDKMNRAATVLSTPRGSDHKQTYKEVRVMAASSLLAEIRASKKPYYVYVLSKPDGTPFYVGMGKGERVFRHEQGARLTDKQTHRLNVIRKLWSVGLQIGKRIESWHDTADSALEREAALILEIGRSDIGTGPLTNHNSGGRYPVFGPVTRARLKLAIKAAWSDPELRAHMSRVSRDRLADPAERKKMGEAVSKWFRDNPELAAKHKRKRAKAVRTAKARARAATKTLADFENPERREKQSEALKAYYQHHPEAIAAMSERQTAFCADPAVRQHMSIARKKFNRENPLLAAANLERQREGLRRPEVRERASELAKQRMAEHPDHQAAMVAAALRPEAKARHASAQKKRFSKTEEREKASGRATEWHAARMIVINNCRRMMELLGVVPPSGQASIKTWHEFEARLIQLTKEDGHGT